MKSYRLYCTIILSFLALSVSLHSQFKILSPANTDTLISGTKADLSFQNQTGNPIKLSYSNDNGISWIDITDNLSALNYNWLVPSLDTGKCLIKAESKGYSNPYLIWEKRFAHTDEIRSVEMSADGRYVLSAGRDNMVKIWDINTKICLDSVSLVSSISCFSAHFIFSNDSVLITAGSYAFIWDRKLKTLNQFAMFANNARASSVHPFLRNIAVGSFDGSMYLFDLDNLSSYFAESKDPYTSGIFTTDISKDGKYVAFGSDSGLVVVYNISQNNNITLGRHGNSGKYNQTVWNVGFSPDSKRLASTGVDGTLRVWDIDSKSNVYTIPAHSFHVRTSKYHPLGLYILTAGLDSLIKQWDPETGAQIGMTMNHGNQVISANYSPTGDTILSAGRGDPVSLDYPIRLWKNIQYSDLSDTISVNIKYPVAFKTRYIDTVADIYSSLPIIYRNIPQTNRPKSLGFNAKLKLAIPLELLDIRSSVLHSGKTGVYDTISIDLPNFDWKDTVAVLRYRTLFSDDNINKISVIGIEFDKPSNYWLLTDTSLVKINQICPQNQIKGLQISEFSANLNVSPNPIIKDNITITVDLLEDAETDISIYNSSGYIIKNIAKGMQKHGRYVFMDNLTNLSNGLYFVKLTQNLTTIDKPIIILK